MSHQHKPGCACTLCKAAASKLNLGEPLKVYGVKVPESWRAKLKEIGAERVREALEKLISENA